MAFLPDTIHDLIEVTSPDLSPDGNRIVFVRTETNRSDWSVESRIVVLHDGDEQIYTAGPKDGGPRFSPDGASIAFLRGQEDGKKQVWVIPTAGGEARCVTDFPSGVQSYGWAPGSDLLALVSQVDPDAQESDDDVPRGQVVRRIRYRDDGDGWRGDAFSQLFIADLVGGEPEQITDGEGDHLAPVWSPDGTRIAYVTDAVEGRDFSRHSEVHVMTLETRETVCRSEGMTRAGSVAWSHDGHQLVAAGSHDPDVWDPRQSWLYVLEPGQHARPVAGDFRAVVQPIPEVCWTRSDDLVYIADRAGESFVCSVHEDGGDEEVITGGDLTLTSLCVREGKGVAIASSTGRPGDIYELNLVGGSGGHLTDTNRSVPSLSDVESFTFDREDTEIHARLLFPEGFDESKSYPLVLDIHGGPNGRFAESFDTSQQILLGQGYLVLAVNPRGSSSYGPDFMKAVLRDWGGEDFLDLMAAVDLVCERPYVDPDRMGVHGFSYGGFMSSWIIGRDHRFKAAVIGAPVTNLYSFFGTSDIGVSFGENQFGGSSIENVDALVERSPMTYAKDVQTPALLMTGEADYRCPIEQTEQFYVALKRQGNTVEFVRFPGGAHGFRKSAHPKLREEYFQRMVDWFGRFV